MTRAIRLEAAASDELADAAMWYEQQRSGLSERFLAAIESSLVRISEWPDAAPLVSGLRDDTAVRSAPVRRFPYRIVYVVHGEAIRVLAVSHIRRESRYWQGRVVSGPRISPLRTGSYRRVATSVATFADLCGSGQQKIPGRKALTWDYAARPKGFEPLTF